MNKTKQYKDFDRYYHNMCGILAILNNNNEFSSSFVEEQFNKGQCRGPEDSKLTNVSIHCTFGFHRLAINGLNIKSNQPLIDDNISLICNGEIYNYKELYKFLDVIPNTDSDCEVIIHLYKKYGIEYTLQVLDGVFSFVLCDNQLNSDESQIYVARDPYGVRPLYILKPVIHNDNVFENNTISSLIGFASEMKVLSDFCKVKEDKFMIEHFEPGTFSNYSQKFKVNPRWEFKYQKSYHSTGFSGFANNFLENNNKKFKDFEILHNIQKYLESAVKKRVLVTDRPIACLLSGGLDSSLITALVNDEYKKISTKKLETYSIGLEGSEDLKYAKIVADYLNTNHTEILVTEDDFLNAIPEVIRVIESYDTTTVRASIGNYLLGKYISQHSEAKVIFNGDGSDELCGGYLYMHKAPDAMDFDYECKRLLKDIHKFDVLRSDKCISSHGLEPRTPFLDRSWVQYYLSIDPKIRYHPLNENCEKYLLRLAFSQNNYVNSNNDELLPDSIIWRRKEAFSDGVSKQSRSLYQIIQEFVSKKYYSMNDVKYIHNPPQTLEQFYYRNIFEMHYPNMGNVVPYFWMPRYVNAVDASARTLEIYNS